MIRYCKMRCIQVLETVNQTGWTKLLHEIIYLNRQAVPVEIGFSDLRLLGDFTQNSGDELIEISPEMITQRKLAYPIQNRYLKAKNYLANGYQGFAMVNGGVVSGDIWCAKFTAKDGYKHPDERWLNIRSQQSEVYAFDMYLDPGKRGLNLAVALQNGALHQLKQQGFTKAYGFYWADNIAALWVHRALGWKELNRVRATRFLFSKKITIGERRTA